MKLDIMAVLAVTAITSKILIFNMIKMLYNTDKAICRSVNYRGKAIPAIGGIVFVPIMLVAILLLLFLKSGDSYDYLSYLLLILCMGFIGVVDDLLGDKRTKGLAGHFSSTLKGVMTTGFLKAFIGVIVSCIISFGEAKTFVEFIVNVFIISLFANTLNLFDLRPGRAVKVYLAVSLLLLAGTLGRTAELIPLILLSIAAGFYITYDLKEICMLGDTGANILGITLGYYSALMLNFNIKLLLFVLLVFMNIISERISLTEIIKGSRLLTYIDSLGRGQTDNR